MMTCSRRCTALVIACNRSMADKLRAAVVNAESLDEAVLLLNEAAAKAEKQMTAQELLALAAKAEPGKAKGKTLTYVEHEAQWASGAAGLRRICTSSTRTRPSTPRPATHLPHCFHHSSQSPLLESRCGQPRWRFYL